MRTDARLLSSLTTAFIECLAPPLLLTQLLAAAAAQLSVVEKHPFTQLQFSPPFFCFRLRRSATQKVKCAIYRQVLQANSRR